ncbi:MAG: hypothetical protein KF878_16245 [Planctomycetes bacterium]|nr:hypothetical protein [Planctomycetota bacterium]
MRPSGRRKPRGRRSRPAAADLAPGPIDRAAPGDRALRPLEALRAALACASGAGDAADVLRALLGVVEDPGEVDLLARGLVAGWALAEG